jgi:hypothetical protein
MHEHAAIWTQIGHTKSRSVHCTDLARRCAILEKFDGPGLVDWRAAPS